MPTSTDTTPGADVTTVRLPHTGLQVPDRSLSVSRYRAQETSHGVAFTANLRVNNRVVGLIENTGHGGMTTFSPHDFRTFGQRELEAYAAQCRTQEGEVVTGENLIDELVTENDFAFEVAAARRMGRTVLRLMAYPLAGEDERVAGFPPRPQQIIDGAIPRSDAQWAETTRDVQVKFPPPAHSWWQAWTGQQWRDVTTRPAGTDPNLYQ